MITCLPIALSRGTGKSFLKIGPSPYLPRCRLINLFLYNYGESGRKFSMSHGIQYNLTQYQQTHFFEDHSRFDTCVLVFGSTSIVDRFRRTSFAGPTSGIAISTRVSSLLFEFSAILRESEYSDNIGRNYDRFCAKED